MFLLDDKANICVNLNWIEAFSYEENKQIGKVYFPWGNDPVDVCGFIVEEIKSYLKFIPGSRKRLRSFHEFNCDNKKILIDLSEIKLIKLTENEIIFYRRYVNGHYCHHSTFVEHTINELISDGTLQRADKSEWESLCSEIRANRIFYPH